MQTVRTRIERLEGRIGGDTVGPRRVVVVQVGDQSDGEVSKLLQSAGIDPTEESPDRIIQLRIVQPAPGGGIVPADCPAEILYVHDLN